MRYHLIQTVHQSPSDYYRVYDTISKRWTPFKLTLVGAISFLKANDFIVKIDVLTDRKNIILCEFESTADLKNRFPEYFL